jgi:hypothetical protein
MRTLRLSLAGMVMLALLGGLGGVTLAQEDTDGAKVTHVTGTRVSAVEDAIDEWWEADGIGHGRGLHATETIEWSDPRLPSELQIMQNIDALGQEAVVTGATLLEGPEGYWTGEFTAYCDPDSDCHGMNTITGHGAYAGLFAVFRGFWADGPGSDWVFDGVIYEGEALPMPEALEPTVALTVATSSSVAAVAATEAAAGQESAAEPAAWSEATVEVLSDVGVIPLEAIPEDADHVTFARISTDPGVSGEVGSGQPQQWANLEYVDEGVSIATIAERSRIWRADGTIEDIPAGVASSASEGDTLLSYNGAAAIAFENGPDEWVSFFLGAGNSRAQADPQVGPLGSEWRHLDYIFPPRATAEAWFSAPIAVSYERTTWEPGAQLVLGSDEVPMLSFIWLESGELQYREVPADEVSQANLNFRLPLGGTWRGLPPADGNVHVLRNEGDQPAMAMGVTLSHASDT